MKTCDQGLENAAQGRRLRAAFSSLRSQFFTTRTDPKLAKCGTLAYKWFCLCNFVIEKNLESEEASNSDTRQRKMC